MDLDEFNIYIINHWMLIPVVPIILLLSFLERRKSFRRDVCDGRPGLIIPFSFLDGFDNRTAYAMAFGAITNDLVSMVIKQRTQGFDLPLWGQALYVYLEAFIGCLNCFPLFACLTTKYRALGAIICILYSAVWLSLNVVQTVKQVKDIDNATFWFGAPPNTVTSNLSRISAVLQGLPSACCYIVLIGYCCYILRRCFRTKIFLNIHRTLTVKPHQEEHVRWVFRKNKNIITTFSGQKTFTEQMREDRTLKFFKNYSFFKYPTRIFALVFVQINIVYWMGMLFISLTIQAAYALRVILQDREQVTLVCLCGALSWLVSVSNSLVHIFFATRNYRYHMLKIYQGDKSFLPKVRGSTQYTLTSSMIYPGYQAAFMMWGLILSFGFVLLITLAVVEPVYLLAQYDMLGQAAEQLGELLSFPATMLALFYLQVYISKRLLLQDKVKDSDTQRPLNVNNRKCYELVNYYSFFTNITVGLLTCLMRVALTAIFGIFSVDRLDKTVFTRDMEGFDKGYRAYVAMLVVDNAHNNPSMCVFAHLLWSNTLSDRIRNKRSDISCNSSTLLPSSETGPNFLAYGTTASLIKDLAGNQWTLYGFKEFLVSKKSRIRWFLAFTLIKNPQLYRLRKKNICTLKR
ncbi:stimulated by retinoic acid gene 6 protein-like [Physella acuta]|uniref:stimulated by retinoic acid gene 6 protein-like n=1 Tax=Physella acuta TaxID=109671 RepID=UPI0027DBD20E|nr:stimulated by retinoic acid gene 6 protein-like [Physella acuta]XP_059169680.1 stimulated by retinoic acid gene 6 protein-like [Physella acuta]